MQRRFYILDVFSEENFGGNQLAVVLDSQGLDTEQMQSIAREFNFSETVFLNPPENEIHAAKLRIFTPANELPFAGHPTVGTAIVVALENKMDEAGQGLLILEENVGPLRCAVRFEEGKAFAEFDLPSLPKQVHCNGDKEGILKALNLKQADWGFENHQLSKFDGGLPYTLVPVKNLDALQRAKPLVAHWQEGFGEGFHNCAYVYCRETIGHEHHFHARMFGPTAGLVEDPATGSAAAALAGAIALYDPLDDGVHTFHIEQGVEMGRPSLITLEIEMKEGMMTGGRIGGYGAIFARGTL